MKVLATAVNNPIFIELQHALLQQYIPPDVPYEFIIFNDAKEFGDITNQGDLNMHLKIKAMCDSLKIQCIRIPNGHHQRQGAPSLRCADSMNFILNYQRSNPPDEYIILDSDMFPIASIPIEKYRQYNCALLLQERFQQYYFWHGILYFNTAKMENMELMNWNCMHGFDTGGMMVHWLKQQSYDTIFQIKHLPSLQWSYDDIPPYMQHTRYDKLRQFLNADPRNSSNKYFCELYDNTYLHYRAGTNWRFEGIDFHNELAIQLKHSLLHIER